MPGVFVFIYSPACGVHPINSIMLLIIICMLKCVLISIEQLSSTTSLVYFLELTDSSSKTQQAYVSELLIQTKLFSTTSVQGWVSAFESDLEIQNYIPTFTNTVLIKNCP